MIRVIVADDEETIRGGLIRLIQGFDMGLEVVAAAENGWQALELVNRHKPELLLMDINMPGLNGLDAIREIRAADQRVKIIIISGYGQFEYAQRAMEMGVSSYLLKPVDYRAFRDILQKTVDSLTAREEMPQPDQATRLTDYIKSHYGEDLTTQALAERFHTSPSNLTRMVKQKTGQSFTDYLNHLRLCAAKELLRGSDLAVGEISERVGYSSQHYFSRVFKNYMGVTPQQYRSANVGT